MKKIRGDKLKYIPTKKIKEILNDPYTRGIDGRDYEPFKEILENILYERDNQYLEKYIENEILKREAV